MEVALLQLIRVELSAEDLLEEIEVCVEVVGMGQCLKCGL